MPRAYVSLGGNLGTVEATFREAVDRINAMPGTDVLRVSRAIRTRAVGDDLDPDFLNAATEIDTELSPHDLLGRLQSLEDQLGRTRGERWAPRTLDLDLILYGSEVIHTPELTVPHPASWYRRFVLDPLSEIAPATLHPEKGITISQLKKRLCLRPFRFELSGGDEIERSRLIRALADTFSGVWFSHWRPSQMTAETRPTIVAWLGCPEAPREPSVEFESLPRVPRLDASPVAGDAAVFLRNVLHSALGC